MRTIKMPSAAQTMHSATVTKWNKAEGQPVAAGEVLLTAEWDQGFLEVTSPTDGKLGRILCPAGKTVAAGAPLAELAESGAAASAGGLAGDAAPTAADPPAAAGGPVVPIVMPQAGQSMEEGTITKWVAQVGQQINVGQILFEVETDKATIEVEADAAGRLARIVVPEGQTVEVKTPVAYLADNDADVEAYLASHGQTAATAAKPQGVIGSSPATTATPVLSPTAAPGAPARTESGRIKASPAARKAAREAGLDLAAVAAGSGPGGRIVLVDVAQASKAGAAPAAAGILRRPLKGMRKAVARNLTASKQTIPHFYLRVTIDAEGMMAYYKAAKPATGCTVNDVVALAAAKTAAEFPGFRTRLEGEDLVEYPDANVGVAVGIEGGLVVPVLMGADKMSLAKLAAETERIVELARNGKVENMGRGTMTISNLGMFGVEEFAAIINPPEPLLLAISAVREAPVVRNGQVAVGKVMTMTLSADHRVVDGVLVAKFAARLKEILENPSVLG